MPAYKRTVISIKIWHTRCETFRSKLSFLRWPIFFKTACFSTPIWASVIYQALLECIGSEKTFSLLKVLWRRNIDIYGRAKKLIITVCNTIFDIFLDVVGLRPLCILFPLYGSKQCVTWGYMYIHVCHNWMSRVSKLLIHCQSPVKTNVRFKLKSFAVQTFQTGNRWGYFLCLGSLLTLT